MDLHPAFNDLLAEFVRSEVSFVLLGGYAVDVHVKPRASKDLELLVSGEGDNLSRVAAALTAFGVPDAVIRAARSMSPNEIVYSGHLAGGLDREQAGIGWTTRRGRGSVARTGAPTLSRWGTRCRAT